MKVNVFNNSEALGKAAAEYSAKILQKVIAEKGKARLLLSTGSSQFDTLKVLVKLDIDWSKVEMFHLDEYVGLSDAHPASFRRYLKDRFTSLISLKQAYFVNGEDDIAKNIQKLTEEIRKEPIDLALIGIGENAHIAFNDPPADFDTLEAYIIVNLDDKCKQQQVGEGWFPTLADVPSQAISMTPFQIVQSKVIVSCVPHKVKSNAIKMMMEREVTNKVPATLLKTHQDITLFLDQESASEIPKGLLEKYQ